MEINCFDILKNAMYEEGINSEELKAVNQELIKVREQLLHKLPFELDELFNKYEKLLNDKKILEEEYIFKKGIKLGANFILDIKNE